MATYSVTTLIDAAHGFIVIDLETDGLIPNSRNADNNKMPQILPTKFRILPACVLGDPSSAGYNPIQLCRTGCRYELSGKTGLSLYSFRFHEMNLFN